uniref:Uncharacterized protein n=1 Tax=Timema tahoe TaxID=61484 RepID=A0A7R9NZA6_9NEOP|nr:unnamed protein product [Timema tahoe]
MNNKNDNASSDEEGEQTKLPEKPIPTFTQAMDGYPGSASYFPFSGSGPTPTSSPRQEFSSLKVQGTEPPKLNISLAGIKCQRFLPMQQTEMQYLQNSPTFHLIQQQTNTNGIHYE